MKFEILWKKCHLGLNRGFSIPHFRDNNKEIKTREIVQRSKNVKHFEKVVGIGHGVLV
jgi:hypothetical protein